MTTMASAIPVSAATRHFREMPEARGGVPFVGQWIAMMRDPLGYFERMSALGPMARVRFGPFDYVLVQDPDAVRRVLQESPRRYAKSRNYRGLERVLGKGLLTSEGDFWRRQRKLAQPAFHHQRLRALADAMVACTADMLRQWSAHAPGTRLDVHREMMRVTLRIAGKTLFGVDLEGQASKFGDALSFLVPFANAEVEQPIRLPLWVPLPEHLRIQRAMKTLDDVVYGIIRERRASGERRDDLLDMLMAAVDDEGSGMTERQLRDEIMTLLLAGHETTANLLSFAFHTLAEQPVWAERVRAEAREVFGDRAPTFEDASRLAVTGRVIDEVLRLYPPAWAYEREPLEDDVLAGYRIPKGLPVVICTWTLHRDPRFWDRPLAFDPDRFAPELAAQRSRYAYAPFGDGPRVCIGKAFALLEAKLMLAMIMRDASLDALRAHPALEPGVTLRPRGGLEMKLSRPPIAR